MSKLVLKDFYADWCPPCKMQTPIIEELEEEFEDEVEFKELDVDEYKKEATEYGVRSIPTIIIEKDGEVVKRLVGLQKKEKLKKLLKELIKE